MQQSNYCSLCHVQFVDYQSFTNHRESGCHLYQGCVAYQHQQGWGHSGPCQPDCDCTLAKSGQFQGNYPASQGLQSPTLQELAIKIDALRSEFNRQQVEILTLLTKLIDQK